ncbi:Cytochrome P450 family [Lecanosticta acicola]|uniref:Cytochrome P450 family n=1 Tax=Lecanosticta acicola TaxID=111012 RepID=A0AAI8Z7Q9_9PEZI|nr:Cytochrome P450 family [Lecanosticta acicola]
MIIAGIELITLHQLCLLLVVLPLASITITYLSSWLQSGSRKADSKNEPPLLPYWLPYLQHLPYFLWNPGALYLAGKKQYPETPFTLVLAGTKFHVFNSPDTVNHVFSRSRKFSFEPVMASMMENGVNLPIPDRPKFLSSGSLPGQPKFVNENHNIWVQNLSGKRLEDIMTIYMKHFRQVLAGQIDLHSSDWIRVNLYDFVRRVIFETSALTFFGPRLKQIWPTMWNDWRRYDDATYVGVRTNWAYYLQPGAYSAREKMFDAFERWITAAGEQDWDEADGAWSESWGFKMNWERDKLARENGFTFRGRACLQASFLFVIVTNAAPMASWFAWCAAGTPERLALYRSATQRVAVSSNGDSGVLSSDLDLTSLKQDPYIHGLWLEALRLGTASAAARVVMEEDMELEGFLVRKGSVVLLPVQLMHSDEEVFPDSSENQPERWMITDADQLKRMNNTMRPFGGGKSLCSGRFVAEHEIIGVVTSLLLLFDIRFEPGSDTWEFNPRSIGVMGPRKDPIVYLRRKPFSS